MAKKTATVNDTEMTLAFFLEKLEEITELAPKELVLTDEGDINLNSVELWSGLSLNVPNAIGTVDITAGKLAALKADKAETVILWGSDVKKVSAQNAKQVNLNHTRKMDTLSAPKATTLSIEYSSIKNFDCENLERFMGINSSLSERKTDAIKINENSVVYPFQSNHQHSNLMLLNTKTGKYIYNDFSGNAEEISAQIEQADQNDSEYKAENIFETRKMLNKLFGNRNE